jgi:hypothetical protein
VAVRFEYWTAVYAVGLEGLNDYDHEELNALASEGWEPVLLTSVHGGFATLVLFRRETGTGRAAATKKASPAKKAAPAKKAVPATKAATTKRR